MQSFPGPKSLITQEVMCAQIQNVHQSVVLRRTIGRERRVHPFAKKSKVRVFGVPGNCGGEEHPRLH